MVSNQFNTYSMEKGQIKFVQFPLLWNIFRQRTYCRLLEDQIQRSEMVISIVIANKMLQNIKNFSPIPFFLYTQHALNISIFQHGYAS